jgi:general secretion pathway protein J
MLKRFATHHRWRRTLGFTLLELLVGLLLLSAIFLLLTSGLQFGTKLWNSSEEQSGSVAEMVTVHQLLRDVLSEAQPLMFKDTNLHRYVFFAGSEHSVRFIAPMPEHLGVAGMYEVAIHATDGDEPGNRLEMTWRLFRRADQPSDAQVTEGQSILMDKISQIRFAYFGYRGQKEPPRWYDEWDGVRLPVATRVRVTFNDGAPWPDLVVPTMVNSVTPISHEMNEF